jgi:hypothetical protein
MLSDLSIENLKLQDKLERAINSEENIDDKVFTVKEILGDIAINELSIEKFKTMVQTQKPETTA